MREVVRRLSRITLLRYLAVSVAALAADMGCFLALLALGAAAIPASAAAYGLGILVHWLLSSRAVFADSVAVDRAQRTRQKALFVGSALVGLAITTLIVAAAGLVHIDPRIAKLVAVAVSFTVTWVLRNRIVFAEHAPA